MSQSIQSRLPLTNPNLTNIQNIQKPSLIRQQSLQSRNSVHSATSIQSEEEKQQNRVAYVRPPSRNSKKRKPPGYSRYSWLHLSQKYFRFGEKH